MLRRARGRTTLRANAGPLARSLVLFCLALCALWRVGAATAAAAGATEISPGLSIEERRLLSPHGEVSLQSGPVAVRVNGVPLSWAACASSWAPQDLPGVPGSGWQRASGPEGSGGWWVYAARVGTRLHTLQLRPAPAGGSVGFWSVLDAALRPLPAPRPPLALPAHSRIDSVIEQLDVAARSSQYLGTAPIDPARWQGRLLRLAQGSGWQLASPGGAPQPGERVDLARAGEWLDVLVLPGGAGSRFVINRHPVPGVPP
jgi:hypothetical protein